MLIDTQVSPCFICVGCSSCSLQVLLYIVGFEELYCKNFTKKKSLISCLTFHVLHYMLRTPPTSRAQISRPPLTVSVSIHTLMFHAHYRKTAIRHVPRLGHTSKIEVLPCAWIQTHDKVWNFDVPCFRHTAKKLSAPSAVPRLRPRRLHLFLLCA